MSPTELLDRWEYLVRMFEPEHVGQPFGGRPYPESELNELGAEGWELATTVTTPGPSGRQLALLFKRRVV